MIYDDTLYDPDALSVEALAAANLGDEDAQELADEIPLWCFGGALAKTSERDRLTFDTSRTPNQEWEQ